MSKIFAIMLPYGSKELEKNFTLDKSRGKESTEAAFKKCVQLADVILKGIEGAANALIEGKYKPFDALVRNFGCQITAAEVAELVKNEGVIQEAEAARHTSVQKQEALKGLSLRGSPNFKGKKSISVLMEEEGIEGAISPVIGKLARFYLLGVVNENILKKDGDGNEYEVPITTHAKLGIDETASIPYIDALQAEESEMALRYLERKSLELTLPQEREKLLQRMVRPPFITKGQRGVLSSPLVYNTEISLRSLKGTLLVKNKLYMCNVLRSGVKERKLYLKMPEGTPLSQEEVFKKPRREPLVVVEGFINEKAPLEEEIRSKGIIHVINVDASKIDKLRGDDAEEYMIEMRRLKEEESLFKIDHIFCSSFGEEI